MNSKFQVRMYQPETDYPLVCEWWEGHSRPPLPPAILPRLGVMVHEIKQPQFCRGIVPLEDSCAMWVYMDNSVGVCFLEHLVTRPGQGHSVFRAVRAGFDFLRAHLADLNYHTVLLRCAPALARIAEEAGFEPYETGTVCLAASTTPQPALCHS